MCEAAGFPTSTLVCEGFLGIIVARTMVKRKPLPKNWYLAKTKPASVLVNRIIATMLKLTMMLFR